MFERPTTYAAALAAVVVLLAAIGAPVVTATTNTSSSVSERNAELSATPSTAATATTPSIANRSVANTNALAASGSFQPSVVYEERGDIANITVKTSSAATVNIGSPEQAFWLAIQVGSGTTEIRLNTYKAGTATSKTELKAAVAGGNGISGYGLTPQNEPLEDAQYPMNVTANGKELDVSSLVIEKRATRSISARIAPKSLNVGDLNTAKQVEAATQEPWSSSIARGDWLVLRVNASGIGGILDKSILDGSGHHILAEFEQANPPMNAPTNNFYADNVERLVRDGASDDFYLFVDTADHDIEPGDRYDISFAVGKQSPLATEREAVNTSIRIAPRKVELDRLGPGDEVVVKDKTTISGSTTLTPGSTINITARNSSVPPLFRTATMTVKSDRTFATTFDFRDERPGRTFQIRLPDQQKSLTGMVAEVETTTPETTTPTNKTTIPETTTVPTSETTTPETTPPTTTPGTTAGLTQAPAGATESPLTEQQLRNGSQSGQGGNSLVPGFGIELAVVALAGALLLARRASRP